MGKPLAYSKTKFLPKGTVIDDIKKRQWIVGKLLGQGGFGAIYTVSESPSDVFDRVIKIEPATNGPLYTEINFYMRVCNDKEISNWMALKKLKFLGIPRYISSGMQANSDNRFLIMDRYGEDLHKILMKNNLSIICKFQIAINMLDALEYIHSREYAHADIKALNILQGYKSIKEVYIVDFGMVNKFTHNGDHKPEKIDNKIKHNGTLEFCPRDSHRGLVSCRRSDIESLMYNLIFWLSWNKKLSSSRVGFGNLPWLIHIKNVGDKPASPAVLKLVSESKENYMKDTKLFLETVGLNVHPWSKHLIKVLDHVAQMEYSETPNYDEIRKDFATIICQIQGKSVSSHPNLNSFREIEWKSIDNEEKPRKSDIATQIKSIKRSSPETNEIVNDNVTKKRKSDGKKRILEVNNSSILEEEIKEKPLKKTTTRKEQNQEFSLSRNSGSVENKIPTSAFLKIPGNRITKKNISKENLQIENQPVTPKPKKTAKSKNKSEDFVTNQSSNCNDIIPGMKVLKKLKSQPPTRSSPRNISKKQPNVTNDIHVPKSVSCQTSPSLSVKKSE